MSEVKRGRCDQPQPQRYEGEVGDGDETERKHKRDCDRLKQRALQSMAESIKLVREANAMLSERSEETILVGQAHKSAGALCYKVDRPFSRSMDRMSEASKTWRSGEAGLDCYFVKPKLQILLVWEKGHYSIPGGKGQGEEASIDMMIRELYEELGGYVPYDKLATQLRDAVLPTFYYRPGKYTLHLIDGGMLGGVPPPEPPASKASLLEGTLPPSWWVDRSGDGSTIPKDDRKRDDNHEAPKVRGAISEDRERDGNSRAPKVGGATPAKWFDWDVIGTVELSSFARELLSLPSVKRWLNDLQLSL